MGNLVSCAYALADYAIGLLTYLFKLHIVWSFSFLVIWREVSKALHCLILL